MTRTARTFFGACAVVALLLMTACTGPTFEDLIASGRKHLEKKDYRTAVIELKAALQKKPGSIEGRLLLGQVFVDSGDFASALLELGKVAEQNASDPRAVPLLARAMLALGRNKDITDRFTQTELRDPGAAANLKTSVATAFYRQKMFEQGDTLVSEALAAAPDYGPARLLRAVSMASRGDLQGALGIVDEVLVATPGYSEGWVAKGRLLQLLSRPADEVRAAFRKAIEADATNVVAYSSLYDAALIRKDLKDMEATVTEMKKVLPSHPELAFYEAQLAFVRQDYRAAKEVLQRLLKQASNNVRVRYLAGAVAYQTDALIEAEAHLGKAVALAPEGSAARKLLARTYLRMGQPEKAVQALAPVVRTETKDVEAVALAAEATLMLGDSRSAHLLFARAARGDPKNTRVRAALAIARLRSGDSESGFQELQSIASTDSSTLADMALISLRVSRREYDGALRAIDNLIKKRQGQPFPYVVQGRVHLAKGSAAAATSSFERALALDGAYFPAVAGLAGLDVLDNKQARAKDRFEVFLRAHPGHLKAQLSLADHLLRSGSKPVDVIPLLEQAVKLHQADAAPGLALIRLRMQTGDAKRALAEAQTLFLAHPGNVDALETLAGAQALAGESQQAAASYRKLVDALPDNPRSHARVAELQFSAGDLVGAEQSHKRALRTAPNLLPSQRRLVEIAVREKRQDEALRIARRVQEQRPREAAGWVLEGEIESSRSRWPEALAALTQAAKREDTTLVAARTHSALLAAGQDAQAAQFAAQWLRTNPKSDKFLIYLGVTYLARQDYPAAEAEFRKADAVKPNDPLILNNLAYSLLKQRKDGAVQAAERAVALKPETAIFLDTLALALIEANQAEKAQQVQERAIQLTPGDLDLRVTLAKIYLARGDKTKAKLELQRTFAEKRAFAGSAEASRLLSTL